MRNISICDISVSHSEEYSGSALPFRIKIEVARLLSRLGVSVIETAPIIEGKTDYFLVKSIASAIDKSIVSVPIDIMNPDSLTRTWEALKIAAHPRLQVSAPVSAVRMEYVCHKKPSAILDLIASNVSACAALCPDVEFVADDFIRGDSEFVMQAIDVAVKNGATTVTLSDIAGKSLPSEFYDSVKNIREKLPEQVKLGVYCSNDLYMADVNAIAAVVAGADEVKTMAFGNSTVSLKRFPLIMQEKSDNCGAICKVNITEMVHVLGKIKKLCDVSKSKSPTAVGPAPSLEVSFSADTDKETILDAVANLGYELSELDGDKVYEAFKALAMGNNQINAAEIDAIVTSVAFQVPATYHLERFFVNTGNTISPSCQVCLVKDDERLENVSCGDGPVDAAFLAIEKVLGRHFELDDFQIRSVTEGREALGETVVKLRYCGRVYSGRGVSKDIVESSLRAYVSAVNKIVYEEAQS